MQGAGREVTHPTYPAKIPKGREARGEGTGAPGLLYKNELSIQCFNNLAYIVITEMQYLAILETKK